MRALPALLVAAVVLSGGCSDDDDNGANAAKRASTTSTTASAEQSTTSSPATTGPVPTQGPGTTTAAPPSANDLAGDRHAVRITAVDLDARTLTVDVVQFLTGEEAETAYRENGGNGPPPNDYYIVNDNPKLRVVALASGATVRLVKLAEDSNADLDPATFEELRTYAAEADTAIFWIDVDPSGRVTSVEEQYRP